MARMRRATAHRDVPMRIRGTAVPLPTANDQAVWLTCALCGREAKGFGYTQGLRWESFPSYRFCSMECCNAGGALARRSGGMINKTLMEVQAIKDARHPLADAL